MTDGLAALLRQNAERAGLLPVKRLAQMTGNREVCRVTVQYDCLRFASVIVTLCYRNPDDIEISAVYLGHFDHRPLTRHMSFIEYERFSVAFRQTGFDYLSDQPSIPFFGVDLWMVERGAGSFNKSVILYPSGASGAYAVLVDLICQALPEVLRELP